MKPSRRRCAGRSVASMTRTMRGEARRKFAKGIAMQRPLCPHPAVAVYNGKGRVVVRELCRDNDAGRVALLDPGDRRGDQIMLRVKHRWIGLPGVKITRAAEGIRAGPAR